MLDRGKAVVLLIFGLAVTLGAYAWWHHRQLGQRSRAFWGPESAVLIRYAPRVELWWLGDTDPGQDLHLGDVTTHVEDRVDITKVRGLVHARHALVEDVSFDWQAAADPTASKWQFAMHFEDEKKTATVLFDPEASRIKILQNENEAQLRPDFMLKFAEKAAQWSREAKGES